MKSFICGLQQIKLYYIGLIIKFRKTNNMIFRTLAFFFIMQLFCFNILWGNDRINVCSPDSTLQMHVWLSEESGRKGLLYYEISYKGKPVILKSQLGIAHWKDNMQIEDIEEQSKDITWNTVYGERAVVRDHFNEKTIMLRRHGGRMNLVVRAYNEGIAFKYFFPEDPQRGGAYLTIDDELTSFVVPENTHCWFSANAQAAYQYLPVKDWPGESDKPLTLRLGNGLYASLAEAEMVNYSRTRFNVNKDEENIIRCSMYGRVEEIAPFSSPWRVIMVAEKSKDLLANNDIILNLNPPCEIEDTNWIKPGKVIRTVSLTTAGAKKVVDFAAERNLQYVHFDAGWYGAETSILSDPRKSEVDPRRSEVNDLDIPEVVKYAKSKNVGIWLYVNQRALTKYLDEILPLYQSWGIAGIKFGFVQVGSQHWSNWLHEAVRKCAKYNLMVDIHDEYRPTGFSRTYPNLLTQEGVRGNEEMTDANINTIHPFTRFLSGAGDYTICYYHRKELKSELPLNARTLKNTAGHQLALSVIYYSPLQFLYWYDTPADYQGEPEIEFFDKLYTVWDDTIILDGEIGEYITVVRRKANEWFVGAITNTENRKITIPFDFLDATKNYEMTLYTDGGDKVKTRTHVRIDKKKVKSKDEITVDLLPDGGCAMIIKEMK